MAEFNRDIKQQEELAKSLGEDAKTLQDTVDNLKQLLEAMKSKDVFDITTTASIDRILSVVDKIQPSAEEVRSLSAKIQTQADGAKKAQDILKEIS